MQTKGSILCNKLYQQWGDTPDGTGVAPFSGLPRSERSVGRQIWRQAWSTAVAQAALRQEERSSRRHGYDKHGDAPALLRELGFDSLSTELQ